MKPRILIVDCNMKIGGIQKALVSLLKKLHDDYEVTLFLLYQVGPLLKEIPANVRVIGTKSDYRYMGMAQGDCKTKYEKIRRGVYAVLSRCFGQEFAVQAASWSLFRDSLDEYDVAISYSHMSNTKSFFGGTAEYVLRAVRAKRKICYIHCDYLNSGNRSKYSDRIYSKFDAIVCVSESTRARFVEAIPVMKERTYAVLNPIDKESIIEQANSDTIKYNHEYINMVSVARLTEEKGIIRIIEILGRIDSSQLKYYVVGDGVERHRIEQRIRELHLEDVVTLCGEVQNPYRHMLDADLLVVPSYHEAAPVVFQEARMLGIPVLTTRTTSADEMIGAQFGYVVDNSDEALLQQLIKLQYDRGSIKECRKKLEHYQHQDINEKSCGILSSVLANTQN